MGRLRIPGVESGPEPTGNELSEKRLGLNYLAACCIYEECSCLHGSEKRAVDETTRFGSERNEQHDNIRIRQKCIDPVYARGAVTGPPGNVGNTRPKRGKALADRLANFTVPYDDDIRPRQAATGPRRPSATSPVLGKREEVPFACQNDSDDPFGRRGDMNASGVVQPNVSRESGLKLVYACRQRLHD